MQGKTQEGKRSKSGGKESPLDLLPTEQLKLLWGNHHAAVQETNQKGHAKLSEAFDSYSCLSLSGSLPFSINYVFQYIWSHPWASVRPGYSLASSHTLDISFFIFSLEVDVISGKIYMDLRGLKTVQQKYSICKTC